MSSGDGVDKVLDEIGMGFWQIPGVIAYITAMILFIITSVGSTLFNPPLEFRCLKAELMAEESRILPLMHQENYATPNFTEIFDSQCLKVSESGKKTFFFTPEEVLTKTSETFCLNCKKEESILENLINQEVAAMGVNLSNVQFRHTQLETCPFVAYDHTSFKSTVMTEWNLICDQSVFFHLFQDVSTYGIILGTILGGSVGDRFGRDRATLISSFAILIGTVVVVAAGHFPIVLCGRFVVGLTVEITLINSFTWIMETCPMKFRSVICMVPGIFFSASAALFAFLAYLLTSWRVLYLSIAWPSVVLVCCAWFMYPSPRWLQQKRGLDLAKTILRKAAKTNKSMSVSERRIDEMFRRENVRSSETGLNPQLNDRWLLQEICSSPNTRKITVVVPLLTFLIKVTYAAVFFYADVFAKSNPCMFFAFAAIADFVGIITGIFIVDRLGRKPATAGINIVAGALILINIAVPTQLKWLQWTLILVAFVLCSGAAQAQYVYTAELFPTVIRARGLSLGGLFGALGILAAPYVSWYLNRYGWWVTEAVLGSCCLIAGLCGLTLPETNNVPACETIDDVEKRAE